MAKRVLGRVHHNRYGDAGEPVVVEQCPLDNGMGGVVELRQDSDLILLDPIEALQLASLLQGNVEYPEED